MHLEALAKGRNVPILFLLLKAGKGLQTRGLNLESGLWFTAVYAIKRRFHLLIVFDRRGTKLILREVALYIALFLRASLLCFHFSLDVVLMNRVWTSHTQPLPSSALFCVQWFSQAASGWMGREASPSRKRLHWAQTKWSLLCVWTQAGARAMSSQATCTPESERLLHTRVSWGNYIKNLG